MRYCAWCDGPLPADASRQTRYHARLCAAAARRARKHRYTARQRHSVYEFKALRGCARCGERDPDTLTLHHRDPQLKLFEPGSYTASADRLAAELAKCDVLCANCHQKEHR